MDRVEKALHFLDRNGFGLEIGPSHNPIAPKKAGFKVQILDHASAEELREKFRPLGVNLDNIEPVDFVWRGEPLCELIGKTGVYDYVIASHVVEHTPDLVSFLTECEKLLKPDGVLSLVVPDKRYCFDLFRWPSSSGDVLQAHAERRRRHSAGTAFDQFVNAVKLDGSITWGPGREGNLALMHTFEQSRQWWSKADQPGEYLDFHNWRFTPASFRLVLHDLRRLGLLGLHELGAFGTEGCEFFVSLGHSPASAAEPDRLELMKAAMMETDPILDLLSAEAESDGPAAGLWAAVRSGLDRLRRRH